jgi:glutaredoxin
MSKIVIFSMNGCGHCVSLKKRLNGLSIPYNDIDINQHEDLWKQVVEQTGHNVVPTIYISEENSDTGQVFVPGRDHHNENEAIEIIKKYI